MTGAILLFGAIAVRPAVHPLIASFETAAGLKVASKWELNPTVKAQIEVGEPFDVVITNPNLIEDLTASGKVLAGSQVPFGRISMGVAAKAGNRTFSVDTMEAFEHTLKSAKSIAYASEGTSGGYFSALLDRLGLAAELRSRLVPVSGGQTATSVARGQAELAVVPITSILAATPDVMLLGPFPAELQSHIDFDLAVSSTTHPGAAEQLTTFLTSPELDARLAASGIERRGDGFDLQLSD